MSDMPSTAGKTAALLQFLRETAILRRKRIPAYGTSDKLLWLADLPRDLPGAWNDACRSAFVADNPADIPDIWLEVRKKRKPTFPPLSKELQDWVPQKFQNSPDEYVDKRTDELLDLLNPQITVLVEKPVPDPSTPSGEAPSLSKRVPEVRRLEDYPKVQDIWLDYLVNRWDPWAQEMRQWKQVQEVYEHVDFMRRRLEEAEERYELLLGVGLLQWRDSIGATVKRHLLTAPAEISLDAARGVLTVGPAASFEKFHAELDMLELKDRPRLEGTDLEDRLEELDVRAWDRASVAEVLRIIANKASPDAQVSEDAWTPLERADEIFRVSYAPALVLRERRPTAYEELINRFLKASDAEPAFATTAPWERFVSEGETSGDVGHDAANSDGDLDDGDGRLHFPLPTNDEQRQIAERLRRRPYVVVKGPPGTGKSHTIANLICHLLAMGQRVLVTAHAPKALTVLHDLLPGDIRNLCVTGFGSSREDHRLLEDSVRGIVSRKNEWKGEKWAQREIDRLEKDLRELEDKCAIVNRQLRECREAETHSHSLPGGYTGTPGQIARQIEKGHETQGWFPELTEDERRCPLQPEEVAFLADIHASLSQERLNELRLGIGTFDLPDPTEFALAIEKLNAATDAAKAALEGLREGDLNALRPFSDTQLDACRAFLQQLEEQVTRASRVLGSLTGEILKDWLVNRTARLDRLEREAADLVEKIQLTRKRAGTARIDIPSDIEDAKLLADTRRRLEHFKNGGWRGWGFLAPRIVRETRYIEECCRVNGEAPREQPSLEMLLGFVEVREHLQRFYAVWPTASAPRPGDPRRAADDVCDLGEQLCQLLKFLRGCNRGDLDVLPIEKRETLAEGQERATWRRLIEAEAARRRAHSVKEALEAWLRKIRGGSPENHHPCMGDLAKAIEDREPARWRIAWEKRESLRRDKGRLQRYEELLGQLEVASPELAALVRSTQGDPNWTDRLRHLQQAWHWAAARAWLRKVTAPEHNARLTGERHRLQDRVEKKLEELAALKAWQAFFQRLDDRTEQSLTAWTKAVARIGKGTGKYAYRHRRTARQYLMSCIPKIPAWIMPLHKLWETTDPTPGVFDTVIVDEASQAGIETLALLLLAKRIVVVGDDKQNSPEAVGVLEDDIARLARDHLGQFQFRDEFRPDTSLYDHAERAFGNSISLREHFRCIPEIIRFSNDLCYTDAPLIPLRQPPPKRLSPLRAEFVEQGACEGDGQRILNRAEAEKIVERIQVCLDDEAYEGKTMGVIVLQGHAQAELIEKRLAEVLDARVREERKLRCGVPATFQGDQRDVIFLSLVVAPNHHFRALTGLPDQRRFNVAMSRARDQVWLFHSVQADDLSREDLRRRLLNFFYSPCQSALEALYEELDRLEREAKRRSRQRGEQPDPYESWFEVDVALELLRRKYRLRPQVDVAGKRIDLVVEGLVNRLAVECDGEAWHGPERFEQDMARQRQLERAGWTFVRIRESEFYANRENAVQRIVEACEELGIRPIGEGEPEVDEEPEGTATVADAVSEEHAEEEELDESGKAEEEAPDKTRGDRGPTALAEYSQKSGFPDPREASGTNIRAALRGIIEKEGPLTKRFLIKLYVEGCPALRRAGKAVRSLLNRALYSMQSAGEIVVENELGDRSLESQVLRLAGTPRVRERPAGRRDLLDIPPSELSLVLDHLLGSSNDRLQDEESLFRALLEHYGFRRLTEVRRRQLARILERYRERRISLESRISAHENQTV
jgi:very-short-patch-repair endonuclease